MKKYSPFSIDENKPSFINEEGTVWWFLDMGDPKDGAGFLTRKKDGEKDYVIIKDDQIIYITKSLENLLYRFDILKLERTL